MKPGRLLKLSALALVIIGAAGALAHRDLLAAATRSNPLALTPGAAEAGRALYDRHCAACHGPQARGDGPAAAALPVRPDDLAGLPAPPVYPDGLVWYRILHGVGAMPAYAGLLSEEDAWRLVTYLRSLSGET